jgi:hypothetical protein
MTRLRRLDLNQDRRGQNPVCCHCTTPQQRQPGAADSSPPEPRNAHSKSAGPGI